MTGLSILNRLTAGVMDALWRRFPPIVGIETTNKCNAACTICPRPTMKRAKGVMRQDIFERLVAECAEGRCRVLRLYNFGEPLMDPDLPARIEFAKRSGVRRVKIFTNGSLLSGERAERLLESGLDEIKISIDGADPEEFARLRKGLRLEKIVENVRRFVEMRTASGRGRSPLVVATCTQTSDREGTERLLRGVVDRIDYAPFHNWTGSLSALARPRARKPCSRVWQTFTVHWNGDVALCCLDFDGREILGNVEKSSIREIRQSPRYRELRRLHALSRQDEIPLCRECTKSFY